jgi:peptidylprolyl isomerase
MNKPLLSLAAALALALPVAAQEAAPAAPPSPGEIVAAAPAEDWVVIAPEDLIVMTLAPDAKGKARQVVIQLMPAPFSQGWVENIRTLARAQWYDGIAVTRVQDNYVAQWGDPNGEDAAKAKALPEGLRVMGDDAYTSSLFEWQAQNAKRDAERQAEQGPAPLFRPEEPEPYPDWHSRDAYASWVDFYPGWPVATSGFAGDQVWWPVHCYGMVGVGRGYSPDTGTGAELYTVIGHAPRHLDRNIALVGRVVEGIEHLSSLPRGTGTLGFYESPAEHTPIVSIRVASDLPVSAQPTLQYLSTESESFARYAEARANRRDPFFIVPAGGADVCNIPVPVRRAP